MTAASTSAASALDDPETREELRRRARRAAITTIVAVVLLIGFVIGAVRVSDGSRALRDSGLVTTGTVVALQPDSRYSNGSARIAYTVGGRLITGHQDLGSDAGNYLVGQAVTVHYDPRHPTRFTIDGEDNQAAWTVWTMIFALVIGLGLLPLGLASSVSCRRDRRVLAGHPWVRADADTTVPPRQNASASVRVRPVGAPPEQAVEGRTTRRSGLLLRSTSERYGHGALRMAGPRGRSLLLAVPDPGGRDGVRLVRLKLRPAEPV